MGIALKNHFNNQNFEVWRFGSSKTPDLADYCFDLVVTGKKTATSSLYRAYEKREDISKVGEKSIVTNFKGNRKCLIELIEVKIRKYSDIDEQYAALEGEGDLTLTYWKKTHREFFKASDFGKTIINNLENELLVCEIFKVLKFWEEK
jgi:uncharacterized protein YhfF